MDITTNYINEVNLGNITNSNNTSTYSASPLGYKTELLLEVEQRKLKAKVLIYTLLVEQIT
jgi:hypothetical protein